MGDVKVTVTMDIKVLSSFAIGHVVSAAHHVGQARSLEERHGGEPRKLTLDVLAGC